jgi:general secretion pathway protein A
VYEHFFGLRERPFDLAPNPRFLFLGPRHREALSTLKYGLEGPRGLTLLIGEAGTGKSTLLQAALAEIGTQKVECVLMSNPTLTRDEFIEFLSHAFGFGRIVASKTQFLLDFRRYVEERHRRGDLTAIIVDEAQSLPHELLEEIRLLSNIETTTTKLLSVVLSGQPELAQRLNRPEFRQLKQRIGLRCELTVFDFPETAAYVAGRLRIAGGAPIEIFTRDAVNAIHQGSGGIPRLVNVISDNALIGGFAAETRPVPRAIIDDVLRDFDLASARRAEDSEKLRSDDHATKPESAEKRLGQSLAQERRDSEVTFRRRRGFFS